MNKSESYKNWALEELMNYLKSTAESETNISCADSPEQIMSANRQEYYKNWALEELMNYVKSVTESKTNISCENSSKQIMLAQSKLIEVEVTAVATEMQQNSREIILEEKEEIVLSSSNTDNLMALIKDLNSSNDNLVKRVTYLSQAIAEFHQDLESYKVQFSEAELRLREKDQELAANYQTIEKLTCEMAIANQLVAQVQADYNEQSHQLSAEKDNCRDLRTRLEREKQHSLQLKVALEKCLEVPNASYQLADEMVSHPNNAEDTSSFARKAPPIKAWTTQTKSGGNQIDLDWDRQHLPSQNNSDNDSLPMAAQEDLELFDSFITEEKLAEAIAVAEIDEIPVASPIATAVNIQSNSPSPLVYPSRPPKGRKTLAAIELPSFVS
ncbi:MAG: hypothetical protein KME01_09610 [Chroococcus sp. CMT-3BRIN-NPC107]|jgi:chromosome segregation ATPase|nr:hypothetical protein [Chroococcus sp. CMT-3BRIN-NPC107]